MKLRLIGLLLVATFALTATPSASAVSFHIARAGTVKFDGQGNQMITLSNGMVMTCTGLTGSVFSNATLFFSITVLAQYSGCTVGGMAATISVVDLLRNARGEMRFVPPDMGVVTITAAKCSVLIAPEGTTKELGTIKYTNNANGTVTGEEKIKGIRYEVHSSAEHSTCGTNKEIGEEEDSGSDKTEVVGSTIKVE
jgi:hypothetical protein